jgi:hypothetical protein
MKPIEIVLIQGELGKGRTMYGVSLTRIYCKHICKYHNVSLVQILYASKQNKEKNRIIIITHLGNTKTSAILTTVENFSEDEKIQFEILDHT